MADELENVRPFPLSWGTGRLRSPLRVIDLNLEVLDRIEDGPADTVVLPLWSDERPLRGLAALIDWRSCGALSADLRRGAITGVRGEATLTLNRRIASAWRVLLLGLGPRSVSDRGGAAAAGGELYRICHDLGAERVLLGVPSGGRDPTLPLALVESLFTALAAEVREAAEVGGAAALRAAPVWWAVAEAELVPFLRAIAEGRDPGT